MRPEPQPALLPKCPDPPEWLSPYAKEEFHRVAGELHLLGLLTCIDVSALGAYCHAYSIWRQAAEALEAIAAGDPTMRGLLIKSPRSGKAQRNPLVKIASDAASDMISYASQFAITPIARSRLAAGVYNQPAPPSS
jgi:P27 family predicted phage terminase small subunit